MGGRVHRGNATSTASFSETVRLRGRPLTRSADAGLANLTDCQAGQFRPIRSRPVRPGRRSVQPLYQMQRALTAASRARSQFGVQRSAPSFLLIAGPRSESASHGSDHPHGHSGPPGGWPVGPGIANPPEWCTARMHVRRPTTPLSPITTFRTRPSEPVPHRRRPHRARRSAARSPNASARRCG